MYYMKLVVVFKINGLGYLWFYIIKRIYFFMYSENIYVFFL